MLHQKLDKSNMFVNHNQLQSVSSRTLWWHMPPLKVVNGLQAGKQQNQMHEILQQLDVSLSNFFCTPGISPDWPCYISRVAAHEHPKAY